MDPAYSMDSLTVYPHHIKQNVCGTRARYRDGRKDRAVKVYTVNQESIYLLISNVPAVGGAEDLRAICDQYGIIDDFKPLDGYPSEEFTEVYLVKYSSFPAARVAKKHLDDRSFLGGILHVCYAPEFETVQETSLKLQERRKYVAWKTNTGKNRQSNTLQSNISLSTKAQQQQPSHQSSQQPVTYVWAGKEYTVTSQLPIEEAININSKPKTSGIFVPRQLQSSMPSSLSSSSGSGIYRTQGTGLSSLSTTVPHVSDSSYQSTILDVRKRVSKLLVLLVPMLILEWKIILKIFLQSPFLISSVDSAFSLPWTKTFYPSMRLATTDRCPPTDAPNAQRYSKSATIFKAIFTPMILPDISNVLSVLGPFATVAV